MVDIGIHGRRQRWLLSRQAWKVEKLIRGTIELEIIVRIRVFE